MSAGAGSPCVFGPVPLAARGVGVVEALSGLPAPVAASFALVTFLGDPMVLFVAIAVLHWRAPRIATDPQRATAVLVALGLGALALTVGLKGLFALSRPPGAAASGYGFPSGHALGATVVYGGAVLLFDRLDRRHAVAAAVVALVSLSRLVLGIHYLVDVVAGVAVGVAALGAVVALTLRRPARAFLAAAALVLAALAVVGTAAATADAAAALGGAVGGGLAWRVGGGDGGPVSVPVAAGALVVSTEL